MHLSLAVACNCTITVPLLLRYGAHACARVGNSSRQSPLHLAISHGHKWITQLLLQYKANKEKAKAMDKKMHSGKTIELN